MNLKSKYKRIPSYIKLNGVPVGIGNKIVIGGKTYDEATEEQYKEIQRLMPGFFAAPKKKTKKPETNS